MDRLGRTLLIAGLVMASVLLPVQPSSATVGLCNIHQGTIYGTSSGIAFTGFIATTDNSEVSVFFNDDPRVYGSPVYIFSGGFWSANAGGEEMTAIEDPDDAGNGTYQGWLILLSGTRC